MERNCKTWEKWSKLKKNRKEGNKRVQRKYTSNFTQTHKLLTINEVLTINLSLTK